MFVLPMRLPVSLRGIISKSRPGFPCLVGVPMSLNLAREEGWWILGALADSSLTSRRFLAIGETEAARLRQQENGGPGTCLPWSHWPGCGGRGPAVMWMAPRSCQVALPCLAPERFRKVTRLSLFGVQVTLRSITE